MTSDTLMTHSLAVRTRCWLVANICEAIPSPNGMVDFPQKTLMLVKANTTALCKRRVTATWCTVDTPVLHFIILWRLPASVSPEQFGKRRGGNASANRGNKIPARISITSPSFCPSISSQNRTLFTSTPIISSRRTPPADGLRMLPTTSQRIT